MRQYLDLLQYILENGVEKESGRANMPNTIGVSKGEISMNLQEGFPLLTTKKMYWKGIVHELLWFLHGDTNIKYLLDNNVNIWNGDGYRWYLQKCKFHDDHIDYNPLSMEDFLVAVKEERMTGMHDYKFGDLGKVYGYQWRNQNGVDQVKDVLDGLKNNPFSRYHIIDAWNKADFRDMALPPCHLLYQFIVRPLSAYEREDYYAKKHGFNEEERYGMNPNCTDKEVHVLMDADNIPRFFLDLNMYQRSCDTFLGVPFNIASMSILLMLFAKASNMVYGTANWIGGDTHLYVDHIPMVNEQLFREPRKLPTLKINRMITNLEDILALTIDDFELVGYDDPHPAIKAELFTGLKKP